jgi:hypothetical protein
VSACAPQLQRVCDVRAAGRRTSCPRLSSVPTRRKKQAKHLEASAPPRCRSLPASACFRAATKCDTLSMFGLFGGIAYLPPGNPQVQQSPRSKITTTGVRASPRPPPLFLLLTRSAHHPSSPPLVAAKELFNIGAVEGRARYSHDTHRGKPMRAVLASLATAAHACCRLA